MSDYELTDSDYDYNENDKILLAATKQRKNDEENEVGVLGVESESEDDFKEDIEDYEDDIPSAQAWGQRKRNYYNTDYVDEDTGGFQGKDAEDAEYEEQEARAIQERLLQELDETDYMLDFTQPSPATEEKVQEKIKTDITDLPKREKLALFAKESPEFAGLIEDFKNKMLESEKKLQPILSLVEQGIIPKSPVCKYIKTKYHLILNYCTNILYYVLLKARRVSIQSHPVIQRLCQYRQLLKQLENAGTEVSSQIDAILDKIQKGEEVKFEDTKKNIRNVQEGMVVSEMFNEDKDKYNSTNEMELEQSIEDHEEGDENMRRAITYQIAKNKGLTPYRKKELRNPRVKHRIKYKKAKIRRKGQVREVRKEIQKYGGEISGINIGVSKSIKLK